MASNIKITFLGTGGSWPTPKRAMPAIALQIDEIFNLLDCGEGTQKQIMKSKLSFMAIDNVFITHFHGDHFIGLMGLVQSMSFNNREKPLHIYGPSGAINILKNALNVGFFTQRFDVYVHELEYDRQYDFGKFYLYTTKNDHPVPALSYRFQEKDIIKIDGDKAKNIGIPSRMIEKLRRDGSIEYNGKLVTINQIARGIKPGRSIVYTGDTRPMEKMKKFAANADVLIHDTTTDSSFEPAVNDFGHSSSRQAAIIAKDADVKRLYLFHYSPRIEDKNILLEDAKNVFANSYLSYELLEYEVPSSSNLREI
ncbi:MAG: ribonuclease Z [Thermoplasmata archaeon]